MKRFIRRYLGIDRDLAIMRQDHEATNRLVYAVATLMRIDAKSLYERATNIKEISEYAQRLAKEAILKLKVEAQTPGDKFLAKEMLKKHKQIEKMGKKNWTPPEVETEK